MLLAVLADELDWGLENAPLHYAVLNAYRAEAFAIEGVLLSKLEGAEWARGRGRDADLISSPLAAQESAAAFDERQAAEQLVGQVRETVLAALVDS
jgi:hypothetical protein